MEDPRFTTADRRNGQGTRPEAASVEDELAKLFERFRLDLEEMFGRSAQRSSPGHEAKHRLTRRGRKIADSR